MTQHVKKQQSIAHIQVKRQLTETVSEEAHTWDSTRRRLEIGYFKYAQELKGPMYKVLKDIIRVMSHQIEDQ